MFFCVQLTIGKSLNLGKLSDFGIRTGQSYHQLGLGSEIRARVIVRNCVAVGVKFCCVQRDKGMWSAMWLLMCANW